MQVQYRLTRIRAAVAYHAVAAGQAFCLGNLGDHFKNVGDHPAVFRAYCVYALNMRLGNDQNVGGGLGYFDGIKHQCKKIVAGLDKLEERLARTDREEILTVLRG